MYLSLLPVEGSTAGHRRRPPLLSEGSLDRWCLPADLFQVLRLDRLDIDFAPRAISLPSGFALRKQIHIVEPVL